MKCPQCKQNNYHKMDCSYKEEKTMGKCTILSGVPGCGKSTYCKDLDGIVCSADDWFMRGGVYKFDFRELGNAHNACLKKFIESIVNGYDVVVDNTNTTAEEIIPYYAIAAAYGYEIELITIFEDPEVCAERNVHGVPKEGIIAMDKRLRSRTLPGFWKFNDKFTQTKVGQ